MNPPDGMVPRIPARTGRMLFGKMFLWRLQMGLSQSAVILDTVFDSLSPEQPSFYASMSLLCSLTAGTIKSKHTLLAARNELIQKGLIIAVNQFDETTGNRPTLYWRFMPDWAANPANVLTETGKIEKICIRSSANFSPEFEKPKNFCTRGSAELAPPFREENEKKRPLPVQIRIDKRGGERKDAGASTPTPISDVQRISLERRIVELRGDITKAVKRGDQHHAEILYAELAGHQGALGFTPDLAPVRKPTKRAPEPEKMPIETPDEDLGREEAAARIKKAFQEFKSKFRRGE